MKLASYLRFSLFIVYTTLVDNFLVKFPHFPPYNLVLSPMATDMTTLVSTYKQLMIEHF